MELQYKAKYTQDIDIKNPNSGSFNPSAPWLTCIYMSFFSRYDGRDPVLILQAKKVSSLRNLPKVDNQFLASISLRKIIHSLCCADQAF